MYMDSRHILEKESTGLAKLDVGVKGIGRIKKDSQVSGTLHR